MGTDHLAPKNASEITEVQLHTIWSKENRRNVQRSIGLEIQVGEGFVKGCKDSAIGHENSPVGCGGVENLQGSVENLQGGMENLQGGMENLQGGVETIFEVAGHYISLSLSHLKVSMPFDA